MYLGIYEIKRQAQERDLKEQGLTEKQVGFIIYADSDSFCGEGNRVGDKCSSLHRLLG